MSEASGSSALTYVFDTLFRFSSDAKEDIIKSFLATEGDNVQYEINEDYFIFRCRQHDDLSMESIIRHLRASIESEQQRDLDVFEDTRLFRVDDTFHTPKTDGSRQPITQVLGGKVRDEVAMRTSSKSRKEFSELIEKTLLIKHETFTQKWTLLWQDGIANLKSRDNYLARIGALTHCRLENLESAEIIIKADEQEYIDKAISKLSKLDGAIHMQQTFPQLFSFPIVEGKMSVKLQAIALKDLNNLKDVRLKSTLLSDTSLFKNPGDALVVTMVQGGKTVLVKQTRPLNNHRGFSLWSDHPHKAFGAQTIVETHTHQPKEANAVQKDAPNKFATPTVARWLNGLDHNSIDPFSASEENTQQQAAVPNIEDPSPSRAPMKPPMRRSRVPRGADRTEAGESTAAEEHQQPFYSQGTPDIVTELIPTIASPASSIAIPEATAATSTTSATTNSGHSADWERSTVQNVRLGQLIDVDEETEEPSLPGRDVRHTMRQRKPKKQQTGSVTGMILNFEKAANHLLSLSLPHQGPIKFEVSIGRLLFQAEASSPELRQPFPLSQWPYRSTDSKSNGLAKETIFTPRLTTSAQDIQSILDVKQSQGRQIFEESPKERKVTYNISCITKNMERIIIEVRDDSSFELKASDVLIGAIDWHYPIRTWDARLSVAAQERVLNDYHRQAQGIVDFMSVQESADEQAIKFSTKTVDDTLSIQSVTLQRETTHSTSVYPDLLLHLREIQDLAVQKLSGTDNQYWGLMHIPAVMMDTGKFWWEVSLTSIRATQILKENTFVEFGEAATWKPDSIIGQNVIKDMYSLTDQLVTNMDQVGYHNSSAKSGSTSRTIARTGPSHRTSEADGPPGMAMYW